jgi:hypothetical protein
VPVSGPAGVTASADPHDVLVANLDKQRRGCELGGSPFYARLLQLMIEDVRASGPVWRILEPFAAEPFEAVYPLRLLGGVHGLVLRGRAASLAARFPSTGGDGDVDAAWPHFLALVADPPVELLAAFRRAVQTNEVARSVALVGGLLVVASRTRHPIRLLELGASAGLNLRIDRYWYEQDGIGWGDPASSLRFVDRYEAAAPPFGTALEIAERRGCDRDPIDATTEDGRATLLSYVWPGMTERFDALTRALEIARAVPVEIDRADVDDWLPAQLAVPAPGRTTVVWHSIVWQYLDTATRARVARAIAAAGDVASANAPLAWLSFEPPPHAFARPELRLRSWPRARRDGDGDGDGDELLARAGFHQQPVEWRHGGE